MYNIFRYTSLSYAFLIYYAVIQGYINGVLSVFYLLSMKLLSYFLLTSSTGAVMLKADSFSAEAALEQLKQTDIFAPCVCFKYTDPTAIHPLGGELVDTELTTDGREVCDDPTSTDTPFPTGAKEITNQSCLYKLWMCSCWASQTDGCLCAKENSDDTITFIRPSMGGCQEGSGPLTNPLAKEAGGLALKCAPNPCLACCACGRGVCRGNGDPMDNDVGPINCCDCCPNGGATCADFGGGFGSYGGSSGGGNCGCGGGYSGGGGGCCCGGGGGGGYGGGGGGCCGSGISQNVCGCC